MSKKLLIPILIPLVDVKEACIFIPPKTHPLVWNEELHQQYSLWKAFPHERVTMRCCSSHLGMKNHHHDILIVW